MGKGLPALMHGQSNTSMQFKTLLDSYDSAGNLVQIRTAVLAAAQNLAPSSGAIDHDLHVGLAMLIEMFINRLADQAEAMLPETKETFATFLYEFFTPKSSKAGVIQFGTIHWSKGLEAQDVYIAQPGLLPLAERIALGGWQRYEELCVQFVAYTRAKARAANAHAAPLRRRRRVAPRRSAAAAPPPAPLAPLPRLQRSTTLFPAAWQERLIKLQHMDIWSRKTIETLWDPPPSVAAQPSSEGASGAPGCDEPPHEPAPPPPPPDSDAVTAALAVLGLPAMPRDEVRGLPQPHSPLAAQRPHAMPQTSLCCAPNVAGGHHRGREGAAAARPPRPQPDRAGGQRQDARDPQRARGAQGRAARRLRPPRRCAAVPSGGRQQRRRGAHRE